MILFAIVLLQVSYTHIKTQCIHKLYSSFKIIGFVKIDFSIRRFCRNHSPHKGIRFYINHLGWCPITFMGHFRRYKYIVSNSCFHNHIHLNNSAAKIRENA